jgi:hypothetical protein
MSTADWAKDTISENENRNLQVLGRRTDSQTGLWDHFIACRCRDVYYARMVINVKSQLGSLWIVGYIFVICCLLAGWVYCFCFLLLVNS